MKPGNLLIVLIISLPALIIPANALAQIKEHQLIEYETSLRQDISTALQFYENKDAVIRFREVDLNSNLKSLFTVELEDLIVLNLFSDVEYVAEVQRVEEITEGNVTITAKIFPFDYSYAYISTTDGMTEVSIHLPEQGKQFEITSDPVNTTYYLMEIDPTAFLVYSDPAEFFSFYEYHTESPMFYSLLEELTSNEMHILDTLSTKERKLIEEAVDPIGIGVVRDLKDPIVFNLNQVDIPSSGEITAAGGRISRINERLLVYTTYIQSMNANELRVFFKRGNFPFGVEVNIFSSEGYAFTQTELSGRLDEFGFYTTSVDADNLLIQVLIFLDIIDDEVYFEITRVTHVDHIYLLEEGNRWCTEDANCSYANAYANIVGLRRATARLSWPVGGGYVGLCSGALLNDSRAKDFQPYILTANHCFSTQTIANSLEARFDYWSTSCNSGVVNPNHIIVNGSNLIATNSQSDFTLVLLKRKPGGSRYYLGWTTASVANNTTLHSTHHPGGTLMKYSKHENKTSPSPTCIGLPTTHYHYTRTLGGRTGGGSSGGPIVNQNNAVVGQLLGICPDGADHCSYTTYHNVWGKFSKSYGDNNLQFWLNTSLGANGVAMSTVPLSSLGFGITNVGSTTDLTITITNTGTRPNYLNLEAGNITITGTNANQFSIVGPTFLYLAPQESGTFTIRFTPTSSGLKTANLNIPHNADNITNPKVITLTGAGNPCSEVISLGGGSANTKTFSKSGTGTWYTSTTNPCGFTSAGREQVYGFVAPRTGIYSIQVTSTNNTWVDYMWKSGSCSSTGWNCISDVYTAFTYGDMSMTAGSTYHILLDDEDVNLSTHSFYIFLNPCLNITNIGGTGSGHTKTYTGGGNGAWHTNSNSACGYWCAGIEKIYSFTAPLTGYYSIQVTSANGGYVDYMWKSGSCSSAGWQCIDDVYLTGNYGSMYWTEGTTYLILLDSEYTGTGSQTFYINPPDPCNGIIPITGCGPGNSITFSSTGAGVWNMSSVCGWPTHGAEQIYSFTAPVTGQYSIMVTSASGGYIDYMWKSGSCSSSGWTCIGDVNTTGQHGTMAWTAGTTYYVMLDAEVTTSVSQTFHVVCPELCHSDCIYDFLITPTTAWQLHSSSHAASYGCKIYRFTTTSGRTYTFQTACGNGATANYDTYMFLYNNANCTQIAFNDDACSSSGSRIEWTADYTGYAYVKIRGWAGAGGDYTMAYSYCASAPSQPGTISGPTSICNGSTNTYSIPAMSGVISYTWTLPIGWTGSSTSNTINATAGANGGTISVVAYNACGTSIARTLTVNVTTLPSQPGSITGPTSVPSGSTNTYSISAVSGATSYTWNYSGSGTIGGSDLNVTLTPTTSGTLSVTANNNCGSSTPRTLIITVTIPTTLSLQNMTITPGPLQCFNANQTIYVAGGGTYFIVQNGGSAEFVAGQNIFLLPGAKVHSDGYLLARITNSGNWCAALASLVAADYINDTEYNSIDLTNKFFRVYPNPTKGTFTLELTEFDEADKVIVEIYNMIGEKMLHSELPVVSHYQFDLAGKQPGIYLIRVRKGDSVGIEKVIKQ